MVWRILKSLATYLFTNARFLGRVKFGLTQWCVGTPHFIVKKGGRIRVGKSCRINDCRLSVSKDGNIEVGKFTSIGANNIIISHGEIKIGERCSLGPNICIYDHDHCFGVEGKKSGFKVGKVIIGNNVWLGAGVIVLRDTYIGNNCVIGAGTVVKGNIPDNTLVTANRELHMVPLVDKQEKDEEK
ncbi:MAG: acyltransferase [Alphaproteobacteria bacterium]|nr:acyltransferase [Alphaproteobacteria bacterium]